ncbi:hypothetical protein GGF43_000579, partial [Coemansia sp. RSA 2618]
AAAENQVAGEAENQAEGQTGDAAGGTENQAEDQMEGAAGGTENQAEDQMEGAAGGTENQTASSANERRLSAQVATLMGQALDRIEQIRELNRKLEAETLHNNGLERALDNYMAMLRQKTDSIREKDGIIDSLEFEVDRLESQAAGHLGNIRGLRRKVDGLNAKIANTDALQSRADQMQSEVNRLEQLAGRHSANINGLNRKVQEQSAKIETLEADNSELNRLSVAHRTHITSLQRALDSERAIANGDDDSMETVKEFANVSVITTVVVMVIVTTTTTANASATCALAVTVILTRNVTAIASAIVMTTGDVPAGERPRIRATSDAAKNQAVVESGNREGNTADEAGGSGDQIENSVNEEDVCRLSGQVATLTTELFSRVEQIRELTRDVEEEMRKNRVFEASLRSQLVMIYQQEEDIREKDDIIESLDFDVDRLEKQAGGHLGNIRGLRRKELSARIEALEAENISERPRTGATSDAAENQAAGAVGEAGNREGDAADEAGGTGGRTENAANEEDARGLRGYIATLTDELTAERLERQAAGHLGNIRGLRRKVTMLNTRTADMVALQSRADWMQGEVDRLELLSTRHSTHINNLKRKIQEQSVRIETLEAENSELNRRTANTDALQSRAEWMQCEVDRLELLSTRHSTHINGLKRKIQEQSARIETLEAENSRLNERTADMQALRDRADWMLREINRLEQLPTKYSANINGLNRKIQEQDARVETLEAMNCELNRLSIAHKTNITSLQRALDLERAYN